MNIQTVKIVQFCKLNTTNSKMLMLCASISSKVIGLTHQCRSRALEQAAYIAQHCSGCNICTAEMRSTLRMQGSVSHVDKRQIDLSFQIMRAWLVEEWLSHLT